MLYGVTPGDLVAFGLALTGLVLVALIGSVLPARRAASVDPAVALRTE
jgi:ABC-type antimicrobial peptide transport system permease subunit